MSKLFETLEKIRENEARPADGVRTGGRGGNSLRQKHRFFLLSSIITVLVVAVLWTYAGRVSHHRSHETTSLKSAPGINIQPPRKTIAPAPVHDPASLNLKACRLVNEKKYWPAIILFQKANRLAPRRPEPLINMAVALSELGLFGPAMEKFHLAAAIAPDNPALIRNLEIIKTHGITPDSDPTLNRGKKVTR